MDFASVKLFLLAMLLMARVAVCAANTDSLLKRLGHPEFSARVDAERSLMKLGDLAIPALMEGIESDAIEVRLRSQRILDHLQQASLAGNLERLIADPWSFPEVFAPGWDLFFDCCGDGPDARRLYAEMLKQEPELLLSMLKSPAARNLEFDKRCGDLRAFFQGRSRQQVHPATVATLLLLAADEETQPSTNSLSALNSLLVDRQFRQAVQASPAGPALRSLISQWLLHHRNNNPLIRLDHAARYGLDAGLGAAREVISNPGQSRNRLQHAVYFMALHGGNKVIPELEELLKDHSVLWPQRKPAEEAKLQVRDIALLGLLHVTGQPFEEYGFDEAPRPNTDYLYSPNTGGFHSNSHRENAHEKWRLWRAKNIGVLVPDQLDASEGELF